MPHQLLGAAAFTLFTAPDPEAARAVLSWLLPLVTRAGAFSGTAAWHVAHTPAGLRRLGLPDGTVDSFSAEFLGGMAEPNRSRFLGDVEQSAPRHWAWGGPGLPPVDGLVLLYAADRTALVSRQIELRRELDALGVQAVELARTLDLAGTEPFGFRDGISQPTVDGLTGADGGGARGPGG